MNKEMLPLSEILKTDNNSLSNLKTNQSVHNVSASKEWYNSTYAYNKNVYKNLPIKDKLACNLINSYFSMIEGRRKKSKRLNDLLRKSTTKRVFISKIETKQTSDKIILTLYLFDREGQYINKQIMSDLSIFKTVVENNISQENTWQTQGEKTLNTIKTNKLNNNIMTSHKLKKQSSNIFFNRRYQDYNVNKNMVFLKRMFSINSRFNLSNYFIFNYLIWILSIFNLKPIITNNHVKLINSYKLNTSSTEYKSSNTFIIENLLNDYIHQINKNKITEKSEIKTYKKSRFTISKYLIPNRSKYINNGVINSDNITTINNILFKLLNIMLKKSNNALVKNNVIIINNLINKSFISFVSMYLHKYNIVLKNIFNKEFNIMNSLYEWIFIKRKLSGFIPYLKVLLNRIYEKNIELNIVNLKHIQLNSSILVNAAAIKLRKKKARLLTVLKRSMKLARFPKLYKLPITDAHEEINKEFSDANNLYIVPFAKESIEYKINNYKGIGINNIYKNKSFTNLFHTLFETNSNKKLTSISINSNKENLLKTDINKNINLIKYKWLTGIKLEANGRLTKRFTASRALHKVKIKGSLQNFQHLKKRIKFYQRPNVILLRGLIRPNIQYSFTTYTRRVGAFGLKSWISSN